MLFTVYIIAIHIYFEFKESIHFSNYYIKADFNKATIISKTVQGVYHYFKGIC